MNKIDPETGAHRSTTTARPITVAITAIGGQGGGVLTQWIVDLAEACGYTAQSTSVPGVAQRTGATVYYVELFPHVAANRAPILALMPTPGDVDIVLSAELMEAGRAMLRGLVSPDRTTLIASTHRDYAIGERTAMGDGIAPSEPVLEAGERKAKRFVAFDMAQLAAESESVISAVLFGALAGSGALPFERARFEDTIRAGGRAVATNLAGFAAGFEGVAAEVETREKAERDSIGEATTEHGRTLLNRVQSEFPIETREILAHGVRRLVDYQSFAYAERFLDRVSDVLAAEKDAAPFPVTAEAARYLALWMSFEDTIRVADLKTRSSRFDRVRNEVRAKDDQLVYIAEFMSPRPQEICELMPARLGRVCLKSKVVQSVLRYFFSKGRRIHTSKLGGFLLLYALGGLRWYRPATLKNQEEQARIDAWLARITDALEADRPLLAAEIVECQRLVKGYSETFERGLRNYVRIMEIADQRFAEREADAASAACVRTLREAALADEEGKTLSEELTSLAARRPADAVGASHQGKETQPT